MTQQNEGDGWHNNGKGQYCDMRHDDGDWRQDDGNRRQHGDGKGQQGDRRYDDGDGRHDDILTYLKFLWKNQFWDLILNLVKMAATVTNIFFNEACGGLKNLHTPLFLFQSAARGAFPPFFDVPFHTV
jgi:hypothetical protein